ncbi:MAG: site-2 protease family protein, partial [Muribaculaceae bacterium]|nr:site-2 protease family protein [Muribaculaceae bacterium]
MEIFIKALQLVVALVILVTVHEFGHYIFARIFGVKVNRFYLFFNPWFSLLRYDPAKGTLDLFARNGSKGALTLRVGKEHPKSADRKPTWRDTVYG